MAQPPTLASAAAMMPSKPQGPGAKKNYPTLRGGELIKHTSDKELVEKPVEKEKEAAPAVQLPNLGDARRKIARELTEYEESITKQLDLVANVYLPHLTAAAETELPTIPKLMIRQSFLNIEQVFQMNRQVLEMLNFRVSSWSEGQRIGDIFVKMLPFLKIYINYAGNFIRAQEVLSRCMQDFKFQQVLDKLEKQTNTQLEQLLELPLTIAPRYSQILTELLTKTPSSHADSNDITTTLNALEQINDFIQKNASMETIQKLRNPNHRKLVHEGLVMIRENTDSAFGTLKNKFKKASKEARLQIWLFNDVLVHMKTNRNKKRPATTSGELTWPLQLVWLLDVKELDSTDPKMPYTFHLIGPRKTYLLRFPELHEKMVWWNKIEECTNKVLTEENSGEEQVRFGRYKFPDKECGEYEGWWKFGRIQGEGVYKFCGNTYTGTWAFNQKCGIGTMECVTGEVFHGEWKDDMPHGYGQLQYINRDRYDGEWKEGMRSGKGTHYYANGDKYDGEWLNNVCHGEGTYTTTHGHEYVGAWKSGKLHGYGVLVTPNGRRYEGEFRDGQRHGEGKLEYANGDFYLGQWMGDKRHGYGIHHSDTEGVYEGYYVCDQKEGQGTMHYLNGDVYEGQWKKNLLHGQGILYSCTGGMEKYEGSWENGQQNGKGVLSFRSGARYEGHFKEDKQHGHGIFISENAVVFDGRWEEGVREGKATLSVGPSKFTSTCTRNLMAEGKQANFMIIPDIPVIHFDL